MVIVLPGYSDKFFVNSNVNTFVMQHNIYSLSTFRFTCMDMNKNIQRPSKYVQKQTQQFYGWIAQWLSVRSKFVGLQVQISGQNPINYFVRTRAIGHRDFN